MMAVRAIGCALAVIALMSCGNRGDVNTRQPARFVERYAQGLGGLNQLVLLQDTKTGACYVWISGYNRTSIAAAPREACEP